MLTDCYCFCCFIISWHFMLNLFCLACVGNMAVAWAVQLPFEEVSVGLPSEMMDYPGGSGRPSWPAWSVEPLMNRWCWRLSPWNKIVFNGFWPNPTWLQNGYIYCDIALWLVTHIEGQHFRYVFSRKPRLRMVNRAFPSRSYPIFDRSVTRVCG